MSIHGTQGPRFIYHRGAGDAVSVDLDFALVTELTPSTEYIEHESEIALDRALIFRAERWRVAITLNLWKYASPSTKYSTICAYKGKAVSLYRFRDGNPFRLNATTDMLFMLTDVVPVHLTTTDYKDGLTLVFESLTTPSGPVLPIGEFAAWLSWGQDDVAPLGDTTYVYSSLT